MSQYQEALQEFRNRPENASLTANEARAAFSPKYKLQKFWNSPKGKQVQQELQEQVQQQGQQQNQNRNELLTPRRLVTSFSPQFSSEQTKQEFSSLRYPSLVGSGQTRQQHYEELEQQTQDLQKGMRNLDFLQRQVENTPNTPRSFLSSSSFSSPAVGGTSLVTAPLSYFVDSSYTPPYNPSHTSYSGYIHPFTPPFSPPTLRPSSQKRQGFSDEEEEKFWSEIRETKHDYLPQDEQENLINGIVSLFSIKNDGKTQATRYIIRLLTQLRNETMFPVLNIGTIKKTIKYGDTSVSMGLAYYYMLKKAEQNKNYDGRLIVLNYGGGGPSCKSYRIDCKNKSVWFEGEESLKQKTKDLDFHTMANADNSGDVNNRINQQVDKLVTDLKEKLYPQNLDTVQTALITGPSRKSYFDGVEKDKWIDKAWFCFGDFTSWMDITEQKVVDKSLKHVIYFISQKMEGTFELLGMQHMYSNLKQFVNKTFFDVPIASLGIGSTTTQLSIQLIPYNEINHSTELENIASITELELGMEDRTSFYDQSMYDILLGKLLGDDMKTAIDYAIKNSMKPILGLKSGFLLDKPELLKAFKMLA